MFELDACPLVRLRDKSALGLGGKVRIVLPIGADVPAQNQATRRLPVKHSAPVALAAVIAAREPPPSDPSLQHSGEILPRTDVMASRPPGVLPPFREHGEDMSDWRVDDDVF